MGAGKKSSALFCNESDALLHCVVPTHNPTRGDEGIGCTEEALMTTDDIQKELNQIDERTHRKLVHYIQTRCCPEDIAEECVQYAYLQALVQAKKIRRSDRLLSWLITVAKRSAWKEMKRRKRLMCAEIGEVKYEEMFENELLMHMDLERILEKQANVWPEYYWQILRLFYEEEKSLVEISEKLRIPQGTIRNAYYRIRRCIRSYFDA